MIVYIVLMDGLPLDAYHDPGKAREHVERITSSQFNWKPTGKDRWSRMTIDGYEDARLRIEALEVK